MFFENPKRSGGGDIESCQLDAESGICIVTFKEEKDATNVLDRKQFTIDKHQLSVTTPTEDDPCVVEITGIGENISKDKLEIFFENKRHSGGGDIKDLSYDKNKRTAKITFEDAEVADRVLKSPKLELEKCILSARKPKRGSMFSLQEKLAVEPHDETDADKKEKAQEQEEMQEAEDEECIDDSYKRTIIVHGVKDTSSEELVQMYFENRRRSGGGDVEYVHIEKNVATVVFKDEEAAKRVIQKSEVNDLLIEESKLKVTKAPPPVPTDPRRLFIRGLAHSTTVELLTMYIEAKTSCVPEEMIFGDEPGTVVVTFDRGYDFQKLKQVFRQKPLEGVYLDIQKVPVSKVVQLLGLPTSVTKDYVQLYFENAKNGGGDILDIQYTQGQQVCLVTFADKRIAERIVTREHRLGGGVVRAVIYHECLGPLSADVDHLKPTFKIPSPIVLKASSGVLPFIYKTTVHKQGLEQEVIEAYGRVEWDEETMNTDQLRVSCTLTKNTKNFVNLAREWPDKVSVSVSKFLISFDVKETSTLQETWKPTLTALNQMTPLNPNEAEMMTDEGHCGIRVVGLRDVVQAKMVKIAEIIHTVDEQFKRSKSTVTEKVSVKTYQLRYLLATKYIASVKQQFKDIKIKIETEKGNITFSSVPDEIKSAKLEMFNCLSKLQHASYHPTHAVLNLIQTPECREYLVKALQKDSIVAVWDLHEDSVTIYAQSDDQVSSALKIFKKEVVESIVTVQESSMPLLKTKQFVDMKENLEAQFTGVCKIFIKSDGTEIVLVSTSNNIGIALETVNDFLRFNTIHERFHAVETGKVRFLTSFQTFELRSMEKDLQQNCFKLKWCDTSDKSGFLISGTEDGVNKGLQALNKMIADVKMKTHQVIKPGMPRYMMSDRGQDFLEATEKKCSCIIEVLNEEKGPIGDQDPELDDYVLVGGALNQEIASVTLKGGQKLAIFRDDLTKHKADVLVNAANKDLRHIGGVAKALLDAGGHEIQRECDIHTAKNGPMMDGEVFKSTPGKLPCKMLLHAVGPIWQGGRSNEENTLYETVSNVLEEATTYRSTSVAIPAISAGVYAYPVAKCARTILKAVDDFFTHSDPNSTIKEVHIVETNDNTISAFERALEEVCGGPPAKRGSFKEVRSRTAPQTQQFSEFQSLSGSAEQAGTYRVTENPNTLTTREGISVVLKKGAISDEQVDVIVNTTSQDLVLTNGAVSSSLLKVGGQTLQDQCKQKAPNGIQHGEFVVTTGGSLRCKNVYHGSCPAWNSQDSEKTFQKLMQSCLSQAATQEANSIAFPAIGTGNLGFPKDVVAREMYREIADYSMKNKGTSVKNVHFVVYNKDQATISAFEAEIKKLSTTMTMSAQVSTPRRRRHGAEGSTSHQGGARPKAPQATFRNITLPGPQDHQMMMVGNITLQVQQGDITTETTDAIVNSTNENLDLSSGQVSQAILRAAGSSINDDCKRIGTPHDGIAVTGAGRLRCRHIIHLVAPNIASSWKKAIKKALKKAEAMKLTSISFPALGTGQMGTSPTTIAKNMIEALADFEKKENPQSLHLVRFTIFQPSMVSNFHEEMRNRVEGKQKGYFTRIYNTVAGAAGGLASAISSSWSGGYLQSFEDTQASRSVRKRTASTKDSDELILCIYSDKNDNISKAQKRIEDLCNSECKDRLIQGEEWDDILTKLQHMDEKVAQIQGLDTMFHVRITISLTDRVRRIRIQGNKEDVAAACDNIYTILNEVRNQEFERKEAELVSKHIQWMYEDGDDGQMEQYSTELNALIERAYNNQQPYVDFDDDRGQKCRVVFSTMKEAYLDDPNNEVKVERVDYTKPREQFELPKTWTPVKAGEHFESVDLQSTDQEYQDMVQTFNTSVGKTCTIVKIQRIQNPHLFQKYSVHKKHMEQLNKSTTVNERRLWHGTSDDTVISVNRHGFNRSYCGKNATAYGNGVYFAVNAAYSAQDTYSKPDSNKHKYMYYCRVLTGEYAKGSNGLIVPPPKDATKDKTIMYDSVVDNPNQPNMFVIFSDTQAYPEYLIVFKT